MEKADNESFEELYNNSVKEVVLDKTVTGKIIEITSKGEIFVDLGYKADGLIPRKEYSFNEEDDPRNDFKVGDEITADIVKMNDGTGNVLLSYKRTRVKKAQEDFSKKVDAGEIFEEKINQINEKGVVVLVNGIRVFIPLSLSGIRKAENLEQYKGQKIKFKVIEYDPQNRKVIGSNRIIEDEQKQKQETEFWSSAEVGKQYKGKVVTISAYGAFVDLGGVQGLLHISEITWKRNAKTEDFFKVGQEINVTIKSIDSETKKIQLAYPEKEANPWDSITEKYNLNDVVNVTVKKFVPFGAFVELEEGIDGLVHISQISEKRIAKPEDALEIGEKVDAKIIEIDQEKRKMELSIREIEGVGNTENIEVNAEEQNVDNE